ncbi:MAG: hypothetical protein AB7L91_08875 [Dehalococcoidia bacterium]
MSEIPGDMLVRRMMALEQALELLYDTFVVHDFEQAWRWDEEDGEPELIEPYANAAMNARFVLDREGWVAHELRSPSP